MLYLLDFFEQQVKGEFTINFLNNYLQVRGQIKDKTGQSQSRSKRQHIASYEPKFKVT